jgi:phosphoribosylaminoimidazole-succinocarboxamide synthase
VLIDEIHTPDSPVIFMQMNIKTVKIMVPNKKQLSKEFVRRWLIENGFQGLEGQQIPEMTDEYIESVSERYIELYENILGEKFIKADINNIDARIGSGPICPVNNVQNKKICIKKNHFFHS